MSFHTKSPTARDLFELLAEEDRRMLADMAGTVHLPENEVLFHTGEPGGTLYVVASGSVEIYIKDNAGQKILLKTARDGDFFGEVSLFDGRARTATAVAVSDCELLALSREDLLGAFKLSPETALGMLAAGCSGLPTSSFRPTSHAM